jgi:hypothetical protein
MGVEVSQMLAPGLLIGSLCIGIHWLPSIDADHCRYLLLAFVLIENLAKILQTCLKRGTQSSNAPVVPLNSINSLESGEKLFQVSS